jgi:hypothetical protein
LSLKILESYCIVEYYINDEHWCHMPYKSWSPPLSKGKIYIISCQSTLDLTKMARRSTLAMVLLVIAFIILSSGTYTYLFLLCAHFVLAIYSHSVWCDIFSVIFHLMWYLNFTDAERECQVYMIPFPSTSRCNFKSCVASCQALLGRVVCPGCVVNIATGRYKDGCKCFICTKTWFMLLLYRYDCATK